jgi:uncharacterized Zn-finger protein
MAGKVVKLWRDSSRWATPRQDPAPLLKLVPGAMQERDQNLQQLRREKMPPLRINDPRLVREKRAQLAVVCPYCSSRIEPEEQKPIEPAQMECPWCEGRFTR